MNNRTRRLYAAGLTCQRKVAYPDHDTALDAIEQMGRARKVPQRDKAQLAAYRCPACHLWHVGKKWGLRHLLA